MTFRTIIAVAAAGILLAGAVLFFLLHESAAPGSGERESLFGRLPIIGGRSTTPPSADVSGETTPPGAEIPQGEGQGQRRLIQITDEPVVGPAVDGVRGKILYFKKQNGHLAANDFGGGKEETVSSLTVLNIIEVKWSPDNRRPVVIYQDGEITKKFVSEATSSPKVTFLPNQAESPAWSPDSKTLWWFEKRNEAYSLVSSGPDGKNPQRKAFTTPVPDMQLNLLTATRAILIPKTVSFFETPALLLSLQNFSLSPVITDFGLSAISDNDAKQQLVALSATTRTGGLQELRTIDVISEKETRWPLKTLSEKCVFGRGAKTLFCAVPQNPPAENLPEAWYQGKTSFSDTIYRINLETGKTETIFGATDHDAVSLAISDDEKRLFFVDKKTGLLYGLLLE